MGQVPEIKLMMMMMMMIIRRDSSNGPVGRRYDLPQGRLHHMNAGANAPWKK